MFRDYYGHEEVYDHPVVVTTGTRAVDRPVVVTTGARVPITSDIGVGLGNSFVVAVKRYSVINSCPFSCIIIVVPKDL